VAVPFLPVPAVGAGLLALWIDMRRPGLAPESLSKRMLAAVAALLALQVVPILHGSAAAIYATVFALLLPALISTFLAAVWLLRGLREAQVGV
jgi:hypothetical protein